MHLPRYTMLLVLAFGLSATAQTSSSLTEPALREHLESFAAPVYPPIAKAAHVEGDVVVQVTIGSDGVVASAVPVSGPAMLRAAAAEGVRHWTFRPFEGSVTGSLTVPFQLPHPVGGPNKDQQKAAQELFPLQDKCRTALRTHDVAAEVPGCQLALEKSMEAGDLSNSDQLGRLMALQDYAHALIDAKRGLEALEDANLAIAEAKKALTEKDQEYAMPFYWRALAELTLGQSDAVLVDLTTAEDTHRRAMANLPSMKAMYSRTLKSILTLHANVLRQLGRSEEAAKLEVQAGTL